MNLKLHEAFEAWEYCVFFPLLAKLPYSLSAFLLSITSVVYALCATRARRQFVRGYVDVYPCAGRCELWQMWIKSSVLKYQEILDVFYLPVLKDKPARAFVLEVEGIQTLKENRDRKRGTIVALGHFGRVPLFSSAVGLAGVPIGFVTQRIDEHNTALNRTQRHYLSKKVEYMQALAQGSWLVTDGKMQPLYTALKNGECIMLMFDLPVAGNTRQLHAPFMGGTLTVPASIARIAQKTGADIVYGAVKNIGRYPRVSITQLSSDPDTAFAQAVSELEQDVRMTPWQWWQWPIMPQLWSSEQKESV